eukprot:2779781-Pyramimonas_sp.AAC.1
MSPSSSLAPPSFLSSCASRSSMRASSCSSDPAIDSTLADDDGTSNAAALSGTVRVVAALSVVAEVAALDGLFLIIICFSAATCGEYEASVIRHKNLEPALQRTQTQGKRTDERRRERTCRGRRGTIMNRRRKGERCRGVEGGSTKRRRNAG